MQTSKLNYVISASPLSQEFRNKLESQYKLEPNYLTLAELRTLGLKKLLTHIRQLNADYWIVALEDVESRVLEPILKAFSFFVNAKQKYILQDNFSLQSISLGASLRSLFQFLGDSLSIQITKTLAAKKLDGLMKCEPLDLKAKQPQHMLYVNANLWFGVKAGGSVGHIAGVVNAFSKRHIKVSYAAISKNQLIENSDFIRVNPLNSFGSPSELNYYKFSNLVYDQLLKEINNKPIDVIYQRMSICNYSGVLLSRILKKPLILEYNGSEVWSASKWGRALKYEALASLAEDVCLKHAYRIVTISNVLSDELIERGIAPEKIITYPNCIDPNIFNPDKFSKIELQRLRDNYGIAQQDLVFTFLGTFGKWHGVEVLAEAIRTIIEEHEDLLKQYHIKFLLIGDGLMMSEVKRILNKEAYKPYVILPGLVAQTEAAIHLALSDVLLSPHVPNADGSRFFGSPTKLFEYMAMGKAIIASDLEQIGEVLRDSIHISQPIPAFSNHLTHTAILSRPGNNEDLKNAIIFLATHADYRDILGMNARKTALSKFTWDMHVEEILSHL